MERKKNSPPLCLEACRNQSSFEVVNSQSSGLYLSDPENLSASYFCISSQLETWLLFYHYWHEAHQEQDSKYNCKENRKIFSLLKLHKTVKWMMISQKLPVVSSMSLRATELCLSRESQTLDEWQKFSHRIVHNKLLIKTPETNRLYPELSKNEKENLGRSV